MFFRNREVIYIKWRFLGGKKFIMVKFCSGVVTGWFEIAWPLVFSGVAMKLGRDVACNVCTVRYSMATSVRCGIPWQKW